MASNRHAMHTQASAAKIRFAGRDNEFQISTVSSHEALANFLPSGGHCTELTSFVCPVSALELLEPISGRRVGWGSWYFGKARRKPKRASCVPDLAANVRMAEEESSKSETAF